MKSIIEKLIGGLSTLNCHEKHELEKKLQEQVSTLGLHIISALPISIVNQKEKIKPAQIQNKIDSNLLYDKNNTAYSKYKFKTLEPLVHEYPSVFQSIDMAVVYQDGLSELLFERKRLNDYWKRLTNIGAIKAMIKVMYYDNLSCQTSTIDREIKKSSNGQWPLESALRDDMRSKKENPLLRQKPYIVVYISKEKNQDGCHTVKTMLEHYFKDNVMEHTGENSYFMAYATTLNEISLRTFYKKDVVQKSQK